MKDNKLLAEYCEKKVEESTIGNIPVLYLPEESYQETEIWNPDTDWNQLMMVVEKIEKDNAWIDVDVFRNRCSIEEGDSTIVPINWQTETKIEAVYNACVEYISISTHK